MHRLALVASHVIQYQDPLFRRLAADPEIDLTVFYCSRAGAEAYHDREMQTTVQWDIETLQGYRYAFLRNFGFGGRWARLINPGIVTGIRGDRFDAAAFLTGWGTITSLLGIVACHVRGVPFFLFGDSSAPPPEKGFVPRIRAKILRALFRQAAGILVSGHQNAEYYRHYGADPGKFFFVPFAIDNERFARDSRFDPGEREAMRARFGASAEQRILVFSGKLVPHKDPLTLVRAVASMRHRKRVLILFLGHGELRETLESYARRHDVRIHFAGFVNQRDLPKYYAAGDLLVLPSLFEPRGLVVNEAMACGLMPVVSDRCGCIGDLAVPGDNAVVFPAGDPAALAAELDRLVYEPELLQRMTRRSREIISTWSFEQAVQGLKEALRSLR